ncbi:MAG: DUF3368 domain-containing protein [Candidatus Wallbacteria bacterium]|nr:DUF3368 domain-containing protein [Candidatus Wallbacteria bacterium]
MSDVAPVVVNSGPIIALFAVGAQAILGQLFGTVLVPGAVYAEVCGFGEERPGAKELRDADWACRVDLDSPPEPLLAEELGAGEAEAITLASRRGARLLLLDDRRARRMAEIVYDLRLKGTAGLLVLAKQRGLLAAIGPLVMQMRGKGYFLSSALIERACREAGEG